METRPYMLRLFVLGSLFACALLFGAIDTYAQEAQHDVDIIIEANTTAPDWYDGRALGSVGSTVRAVAVPIINGSSAGDYYYHWKLNNETLLNGPTANANEIFVTIPRTGNGLLSVQVQNAQGTTLASRSIQLEAATPEVHFYEINPLRGDSVRAIGSNYFLTGEEITFAAEPYFMDQDIFTGSGDYAWKLANQTAPHDPDNPTQITVRSTGGSGSAKLHFGVRNTNSLLQYVSGTFTIFFE